jgi:CDP-diacylglycerol--serine O-phosphatidyltransferase
MSVERRSNPNPEPELPKIKIPLLPNLLTAGNLYCGFLALTKIVEADLGAHDFHNIRLALFYILLACILDLLDGRVARMSGVESPFGREFDSLADIVSFGVAPAFLVHRVVLARVFTEHKEWGWFIAAIYVICGAFRLARFNCVAAMAGTGGGKYFTGFPIPAAAGVVSSLTLFLLWWDEKTLWDEKSVSVGAWGYSLPVMLLFLSWMMVSEVKYPAFKKLDWRATRPFAKTLTIVMVLGFIMVLRTRVLPVVAPFVFISYLLYGFVRPYVSRRIQREIEVDDDDDDEDPENGVGDTSSGPRGM